LAAAVERFAAQLATCNDLTPFSANADALTATATFAPGSLAPASAPAPASGAAAAAALFPGSFSFPGAPQSENNLTARRAALDVLLRLISSHPQLRRLIEEAPVPIGKAREAAEKAAAAAALRGRQNACDTEGEAGLMVELLKRAVARLPGAGLSVFGGDVQAAFYGPLLQGNRCGEGTVPFRL
jgi:hypothetical protein